MQMRHSDQHIHNCTIAGQPSTAWLQSNGIVHDVATFDQFQSLNTTTDHKMKPCPFKGHKKTTSCGGGFFGRVGCCRLGMRSQLSMDENVLPGIELFSQGATPQISSPLMRFTTEFGMDRSGTTPLWTPG